MPQRHSSSAFSRSSMRFVCGVHPVTTLLAQAPQKISEIYCAPPPHRLAIEKILTRCQELKIPIRIESVAHLNQLSQDVRHQGIMALAKPFEYADFNGIKKTLLNQENGFVVILDSLQDNHNLGAIIRSACAFFCQCVIIPKDRSAQVTSQTERASAGATFLTPIARVTNLSRAIEELKEIGFWTVGANSDTGSSLYHFDFPKKIALVIGSEESGMRDNILKKIDFSIKIPISEAMESLNASNAAAIIMYEIAKKCIAPYSSSLNIHS